jgi:hypothetical protein
VFVARRALATRGTPGIRWRLPLRSRKPGRDELRSSAGISSAEWRPLGMSRDAAQSSSSFKRMPIMPIRHVEPAEQPPLTSTASTCRSIRLLDCSNLSFSKIFRSPLFLIS